MSAMLSPINPSLLLIWMDAIKVPYKFRFLVKGEVILLFTFCFFYWKHFKHYTAIDEKPTAGFIMKDMLEGFLLGIACGISMGIFTTLWL